MQYVSRVVSAYGAQNKSNFLAFTNFYMNVKAIWINDQKVESTEEGTLEKAFLRVNLQPFIHIGKNSLVCKIHYNQPDNVYEVLFDRDDVTESLINCLTYDTEIDSVYLRGQFGAVSYTHLDVYKRQARSHETQAAQGFQAP